jgi:signal transduction histidine kinase
MNVTESRDGSIAQRLAALPVEQLYLLRGLGWPLIGATALAGILLALPSEPLLQVGWSAPVRFGVPLGIAQWLTASWPRFAFSVVVGVNTVVFATILSNFRHPRLGIAPSLALAVVASSLLACALLATTSAASQKNSFPWHPFAIASLTWGITAVTWYALEHARLITWKGLAFLFLFALVNYIRSVANQTGPDDERVLSAIGGALLNVAVILPMVLGVISAVNHFPVSGRQQRRAVALAVVLGAALGALLQVAVARNGNFVDWSDPHPLPHFAKAYQGGLLRLGILGALFAAVYAYYRNESSDAAALQQAELDQAALDAQMDEARLQVLQAQIEPHFLFNTLAHVKFLYQTDPQAAREMLENLMSYFTIALPQMRERDSTVEREATLVEAYLNIQRIRMGRRLSFEISLPDALLGAHLPPMMLLTLVENAIKHGLGPLPEGGFIRIDAKADAGALHVQVADTGCGFISTSGTGTGLANIRARLTAAYGKRGRLALKPNAPRGVTAGITIPLTVAVTQDEPS